MLLFRTAITLLKEHRVLVVKSVLLVLLMVALVLLLRAGFFSIEGIEQFFIKTTQDDSQLGWALLILSAVLVQSLGLPRQFIALSFGLVGGFVLGAGLALLTTTLSALMVYTIARFFFPAVWLRHLLGRFAPILSWVEREVFFTSLLFRLLPLGSNFVFNLSAGAAHLPWRGFLAGSFLGFVPQTLIFSLMGSGVAIDESWRIGVSVVLFAVTLTAFLALYRYRKQTR